MSTTPSLHTEKEDPIPVLDPKHAHPLAQLSQVKKNLLLLVFSIATFLDVCNVSGVALAVAEIRVDLDLAVNQIAWVS